MGNTALVSLSLADQACCCSGVIPSCCHPRRVPLWLPGGWGGEGAESTGAGAGGLAVHRLTRTEPQIEYKFPDWAETSANSWELACSAACPRSWLRVCPSLFHLTSLPRRTSRGLLRGAPAAFTFAQEARSCPELVLWAGCGPWRAVPVLGASPSPGRAALPHRGLAGRSLRREKPIPCLSRRSAWNETRQVCWPYRLTANHIIPHRLLQRLWASATWG